MCFVDHMVKVPIHPVSPDAICDRYSAIFKSFLGCDFVILTRRAHNVHPVGATFFGGERPQLRNLFTTSVVISENPLYMCTREHYATGSFVSC